MMPGSWLCDGRHHDACMVCTGSSAHENGVVQVTGSPTAAPTGTTTTTTTQTHRTTEHHQHRGPGATARRGAAPCQPFGARARSGGAGPRHHDPGGHAHGPAHRREQRAPTADRQHFDQDRRAGEGAGDAASPAAQRVLARQPGRADGPRRSPRPAPTSRSRPAADRSCSRSQDCDVDVCALQAELDDLRAQLGIE